MKPFEGTAPWHAELTRSIQGADVGVAVALGDRLIYEHGADELRTPASNQKLLLSMALLETFHERRRFRTFAVTARPAEHVVRGDVFVIDGGDPTFGDSAYRRQLGLDRSSVDMIARRIASRGIRRIEGSIIGVRSSMRADWDAPGWQSFVLQRYITRPTSLSLNGNAAQRPAPELQVAAHITQRLEDLGVSVVDDARMVMREPRGPSLALGAAISPPLVKMLGIMNRDSNNFFAEVLGKRLALRCLGEPGTIAKGARAIRRWASSLGVKVVAHDSSGLSYKNRISARGMVRLLVHAREQRWGSSFVRTLPRPGQGTLSTRLMGVRVRAKTGSLFNGSSSLAGWVWMENEQQWAAFSIMSTLGGEGASIADRLVERIAKLDL